MPFKMSAASERRLEGFDSAGLIAVFVAAEGWARPDFGIVIATALAFGCFTAAVDLAALLAIGIAIGAAGCCAPAGVLFFGFSTAARFGVFVSEVGGLAIEVSLGLLAVIEQNVARNSADYDWIVTDSIRGTIARSHHSL
ncbi:MAG TPA: hypothetical protein VF637_09130 [Sphingomicrobium sp.]